MWSWRRLQHIVFHHLVADRCMGLSQAKLAEFMGTDECILYSYDMATVPSVIPAFANAKDIILCDEVSTWHSWQAAGQHTVHCRDLPALMLNCALAFDAALA